MSEFNRRLIDEYRASGGRVGGSYEGAPLLLLTTTGAKSGRPHTTPLMYLEDGGRLVVFGTAGGAPNNPDWYYNLLAQPEATVELGPDTSAVRATVAAGPERERLAALQAERRPDFADYEATSARKIPVVVLERLG
jgi:deazaflavin-dependent oxidoreductase (nitroreductase family)